MKQLLPLFFLLSSLFYLSCAGDSASCGDGIVRGAEQCDDGNTASGDGCAYNCKLEAYCNNGVCEEGEVHTCPQDCDVCGNGVCDLTESVSTCFPDCYCGNGSCDEGESTSICPIDCQNVPLCGDGICELGETTLSCLQDCYCLNGSCDEGESQGTCPQDCVGAVCGDGSCDTGEIPQNCPQDCETLPECGNGTCETGETPTSCPQDCSTSPVCGNGTCETGETPTSCPQDCSTSPVCGNGTCETGETAASCPADCGGATCGNGTVDAGEQCDTSNLGGATCVSLGFDVGSLGCTGSCTYDTGSCTSAATCDIWTQTGCQTGEKCTANTSTENRCNTAGTALEGEQCYADADCAPYLGCGPINNSTISVCRRFCRDKTSNYDQLHCTGSAGSICYYDIAGFDALVIPDVKFCTLPCDPVAGTGCAQGLQCDLFDVTRPTGTTYFTECFNTADSNSYCNGAPCPNGYGCVFDGYTIGCKKYCSTAPADACPGGMACLSFYGFHAVIGSVEYGYCDYI